MIIPIKCFTCGKVLADKYRYFQRKSRESRAENNNENIYLTLENKEQSKEAIILNDIGIHKLCCRRHMLTHVDVI